MTDKGIEMLVAYVAAVREAIGMEIPLSMDHLGHLGVNSIIRWAKHTSPTIFPGWKMSFPGSTRLDICSTWLTVWRTSSTADRRGPKEGA